MAGTRMKRSRASVLVAAGAMVLSLVAAGGASAAPAEQPCTITGYSPTRFVVGATSGTREFTVRTTGCTRRNWRINIVLSETAPMLATKRLPVTTFFAKELVNADAGSYPVVVIAKSTDDKVSKKKFKFFLVRRSTFGTTLDVGPEPASEGDTLQLRGTLKRVSWGPNPSYVPYPDRTVEVQFRASGTRKYVTVKNATTDAQGNVATTVSATRSGFWRLHFDGNAATGGANSNVDGVRVS